MPATAIYEADGRRLPANVHVCPPGGRVSVELPFADVLPARTAKALADNPAGPAGPDGTPTFDWEAAAKANN